MTSADVTLRTLSLGNPDATTGWYAKTFTDSTIKMVILPRGATFQVLGMGYYARYDHSGFTVDPATEGSEIQDSFTNYYEVKTIKDHAWLNTIIMRECELSKLSLHGDRPATSGTWPTVEDPRYRTKVWLSPNPPGYLIAANMKKDNNTDNASFIVAFGLPDYYIEPVFLTPKNIDVVFSIDKPESEALPLGVGYIENIPISVFSIDKVGITGSRLGYAAEVELRRVAETQPMGSLRTLSRSTAEPKHLGSTILHSVSYIMRYKRYA